MATRRSWAPPLPQPPAWRRPVPRPHSTTAEGAGAWSARAFVQVLGNPELGAPAVLGTISFGVSGVGVLGALRDAVHGLVRTVIRPDDGERLGWYLKEDEQGRCFVSGVVAELLNFGGRDVPVGSQVRSPPWHPVTSRALPCSPTTSGRCPSALRSFRSTGWMSRRSARRWWWTCCSALPSRCRSSCCARCSGRRRGWACSRRGWPRRLQAKAAAAAAVQAA